MEPKISNDKNIRNPILSQKYVQYCKTCIFSFIFATIYYTTSLALTLTFGAIYKSSFSYTNIHVLYHSFVLTNLKVSSRDLFKNCYKCHFLLQNINSILFTVERHSRLVIFHGPFHLCSFRNLGYISHLEERPRKTWGL